MVRPVDLVKPNRILVLVFGTTARSRPVPALAKAGRQFDTSPRQKSLSDSFRRDWYPGCIPANARKCIWLAQREASTAKGAA